MNQNPTPTPAPAGNAGEGPEVAHRSPLRAALYSAAGMGWGQIYNKQLDKAVLLWIWTGVLTGLGALLLMLGLLGTWVPRHLPRPPLGDRVADHAAAVAGAWCLAMAALWTVNIYDAYRTAGRINRREVTIRHGMRRQMVHVLTSQLLGFLPLVGFLFPPAVVAEAIDAVEQRREPDRHRLFREGGQAALEWFLTKLAVYALWGLLAVWLLWWLLRTLGLPL